MASSPVGKKATPGQQGAAVARAEGRSQESLREAAKGRNRAIADAAADSYAKTVRTAKSPEVGGAVREVLGAIEGIIRKDPQLESPLWAGVKAAMKAGKGRNVEDGNEAQAERRRQYYEGVADRLEGLAPLPAHKGRSKP